MAAESPAPRRVLVAASPSKHSKEALLWTLDKLVQNPDDILVLLHVLKPVQYVATSEGYKDVSQVEKEIVQKIDLEARRMGEQLLESFENLCAPKKVEALTKLVEGDRRKVILEECERMGATNLVIGSGGRRLLKLKSTSLTDYCLKHALCAVSVIRKGSVLQSSPAKPGLKKAPQTESAKGLLLQKVEEASPAPKAVTLSPKPLEVPALSESDRARWRSSADEAPAGEEEPEEGGENGREIAPGESETNSDFLARFINKARAEELTRALAQLESAGALDSSSSAGEVTRKIGEVFKNGGEGQKQLTSEQGPISKPEASEASKVGESALPLEAIETGEKEGPPSKEAAASTVEDFSLTKDTEVPVDIMPKSQVGIVAKKELASNLGIDGRASALEVGSKELDGKQRLSVNPDAGQAVDVAVAEASKANQPTGDAVEATATNESAGSADVAAAEASVANQQRGDAEVAAPEAATMSGPISPVSDKEVDPNSLSVNEVTAEVAQTRAFKGEFDSEASLREREDSFGEFKSQSSIDQELLQMMTLSKKDPVEKEGVLNGFIQYKRPDTPGFTRGLEVLEVLDRWLQEQRSRGQSEEDTCHLESDPMETAKASPTSQEKKGSRLGRLFRKAKKGERVASPEATAGAFAVPAGSAGDDEQESLNEVGEADESGLVNRIADNLDVGQEGKGDLPAADDPYLVALQSAEEIMSSDPEDEIERKRSASDLQALLEEDDASVLNPKPLQMAEGQPPSGRVKVKVQLLNMEARAAVEQTSSPRPPGVSKRVSRALLEGMVPELPREDPEDSVTRPLDDAPKPAPALDAHQQELSKYSLEGWLGIGQCVNRFLEDDRSSISSEAFESIGEVTEEDREAARQTWDSEPRSGHVATDDWGYGASRLGGEASKNGRPKMVKHIVQQYEERAGVPRMGGFAKAGSSYEDMSRNVKAGSSYEDDGRDRYEEAVEDPQVSEFMRAVSKAQEQVAEQYGQPIASTSGARNVDYGRRSGFSSYWRSTEAAAPEFETLPTNTDLPKFGGIALRSEPQAPPAEREATAAPPTGNKSPPKRRREKEAYDSRKWALPEEQAIETRVLKRHPSEERLFGVEEQADYWPQPEYQEEPQQDALSALSISQAITDLESATFADLVTDGRIASSQVAHWREEVAWLTSPGDDIMELVVAKAGNEEVMIQRPRPDVHTNLPALRSLDELLQRILLRMNAGAAANKRDLMGTREQTIQVLKAALMINEEVLQDMGVPQAYWDKLPQTIKQVLGVDAFSALTARQVNPVHLLTVINPRTMQDAWRCVNNLEAAMLMWRAMMADMAEPLATKRATYAKRAAALVHDLKMTWPSLQVTQLAELKITRNTDVGRAILESYSRALVSLCGKTISCLDYLLTLDVPSTPRPRSIAESSKRPSDSPRNQTLASSSSSLSKSSSGKLTGRFMKLLGRR